MCSLRKKEKGIFLALALRYCIYFSNFLSSILVWSFTKPEVSSEKTGLQERQRLLFLPPPSLVAGYQHLTLLGLHIVTL